jgi:hypothetical protein
MPDLSGRTEMEVSQILAALDVRILVQHDTVLMNQAQGSLQSGLVVDQTPPAGARLNAGETVRVRVVHSITLSQSAEPPPDAAGAPDTVRDPPFGDMELAASFDRDRDGIPDDEDSCPNTPAGATVLSRGCSQEQYDDYVASLPKGSYAFNTQDTMVVEHNYVIVLVLKPDAAGELPATESSMQAIVIAEMELAGTTPADTSRIEVRQRPFSSRMRAALQGPAGWQVRARAGFDETRLISQRDSTVWIWDVTPRGCSSGLFRPTLDCGNETLNLAVYAFFGPDSIPWPMIQERIYVRVTLGQKFADIALASFPWVGLLLLPAVGAAWWSHSRRRITILFLAANPHDTSRLNLDEEIRAIDGALQKAPHRNRFRIEQHWAVRSTELDDFLLRHRPQIVHFSGHGSAASELILEAASTTRDVRRAAPPERTSEAVSSASLARVFAPLKGTVRCVVMNACYSETQAAAIAEYVDCVVGMSRAIADSAAINFSSAFYQALAHGESIDHAFELACSEIDRASLADDDVPQLIGRGNAGLAFVRRRS